MPRKVLFQRMLVWYCVAILLMLCLVQAGSRAVTVLVEQSPAKNRTCIAIDAGHGGIDGGAVSISGVPESQINLQIAERLNDLLHLMGYHTFMMRTTDTSLHTDGTTISSQKISDLKHRVEIAAELNTALLISIHQNTFSDERYHGAQVFYRSDDDSIALASQLQDNFVRTINIGSKRKSKAAKGIYLMEHIHCPAVLIECGFLTNAYEEAQLNTAFYQKQICAVIAASVSTHCR